MPSALLDRFGISKGDIHIIWNPAEPGSDVFSGWGKTKTVGTFAGTFRFCSQWT